MALDIAGRDVGRVRVAADHADLLAGDLVRTVLAGLMDFLRGENPRLNAGVDANPGFSLRAIDAGEVQQSHVGQEGWNR